MKKLCQARLNTPPATRLARALVPGLALLSAQTSAAAHDTHDLSAAVKPAAASNPAVVSSWWQAFADETLQSLIQQALSANREVLIAQARLQQAQALLDGSAADYKPQLQAGAEAKRFREVAGMPMTKRSGLGLRASWELDWWGRGAAGVSAAQADAASQQAALALTQITLVADLAQAYYDLRMLAQRVHLIKQAITLAQRQLEVVQAKYQAGAASLLDAERWRSELAQEQANLAQLQSVQQLRRRQVALLSGQREVANLTDSTTNFLAPAELAMPNLTAQQFDVSLLETRPDVQAKARQLDAALARAGVARRELYPSLSFSWAGTREHMQNGLASNSGFSLGYGLTLSLPILDGGRIRSNIALHDARVNEARADYEKVLLHALVELDSNWQLVADSQTIYQRWLVASQSSARAALQAERLYQAGVSDVSAVLDARRADLKAQDALVQADSALWQAALALRRAFAGTV